MTASTLFKRLGSHDWVQRLLARLIALYLYLVMRTIRWKIEIDPATERLVAAGGTVIGCFWHGRLAGLPFASTHLKRHSPGGKMRGYCLISDHRDGRIIAHATRYLGFQVVIGSTKRGGLAAFIEMRRILRQANIGIAIAPDGPRGPRMRVSPGIIRLAAKTGVPILPFTFSCKPQWRMRSWDAFVLPLPFGRGVIRWGALLPIAPDLDEDSIKAACKALEAVMVPFVQDTDHAVGVKAVEHDDASARLKASERAVQAG